MNVTHRQGVVLTGLVIGTTAVARSWPGFLPAFTAGALAVAAVAVAATAALAWGARRDLHPASTLAVAVLAAAATGLLGGKMPALWVLVTTVVAPWVLMDRPPWRGLPRCDPAARGPVLGFSLLATYLASKEGQSIVVMTALVGVVALFAVLGAFAPKVVQGFVRLVDLAVAKLAGWLLGLVMFVVWAVVALVPWLLRWNPTWAPADRATGWVRRRHTDPEPDRMWVKDAFRVPLFAAHRLRSVATTVLGLAVVAGLVAGTISLIGALSPDPPETAAPPLGAEDTAAGKALKASPWFQSLSDASARMYQESQFSQFVGLRLGDLQSKYLNIVDEERRSWVPTTGACADLPEVWLFGGSTVFGVGQRDDHTIASAVARAAAANGTPVRVRSFGVPGDVAWQENRRLELMLQSRDRAPDAVVFYDGYNDLEYTSGLKWSDRGGVGDPIGPLDRLHMPVLDKLGAIADGDEYVVKVPRTDTRNPRAPAVLGLQAAAQYQAAEAEAATLLGARGIPYVRFNQPTLRSRATPVEGEFEVTPEDRTMYAAFRSALPKGTIDLSGLFDGSPEPVYVDQVHTEEATNDQIARAVLLGLTQRAPGVMKKAGQQQCS